MPDTIELAENRYGKSRVRLKKVNRTPAAHEVCEWTVEVLCKGDFLTAHTEGDNTDILATDTMKNMVYSLARSSPATNIETFAFELATFVLLHNPQVTSTAIRIESALWKRLTIDGKPHPTAFMHGSDEVQTTRVEVTQTLPSPTFHSGLDHLVLLKTAHSAFAGYRKDAFTTLPETQDRLFCTALRAEWLYTKYSPDFDAARTRIREAMLKTFAHHDSKSVQQTLYAMGEAALLAEPNLAHIELAMPNKHCLLVDLSRFSQDNPNTIFTPTDEPHGYIEARIRRKPYAT